MSIQECLDTQFFSLSSIYRHIFSTISGSISKASMWDSYGQQVGQGNVVDLFFLRIQVFCTNIENPFPLGWSIRTDSVPVHAVCTVWVIIPVERTAGCVLEALRTLYCITAELSSLVSQPVIIPYNVCLFS